MATLSIAAILLATAAPGLLDFLRDAERDGLVADMVAALSYTRSEAIKRGHQVTLCPSTDGLVCTASTAWESGWIVFADADGSGTVTGTEAVLRYHQGAAEGQSLRGARPRFAYRNSGLSVGYTDTIRACDTRGVAAARSVLITNTGRVRVADGASSCP